jgi:hypothetical protein
VQDFVYLPLLNSMQQELPHAPHITETQQSQHNDNMCQSTDKCMNKTHAADTVGPPARLLLTHQALQAMHYAGPTYYLLLC